jgi:hypothetical protein
VDFLDFARWALRPDVVATPLSIRHHIVSAFPHPLQQGAARSITLIAPLEATRLGPALALTPQS